MKLELRPWPLLARASVFAATLILSVFLWFELRAPIGDIVARVTDAALRLSGEIPVHPNLQPEGSQAHGAPVVGVLLESRIENGRQRHRSYAVPIERFHVNAIAIVPLVASLGTASPLARLGMLGVALPLLLLLDACNACAFLLLAANRQRGDLLFSPGAHASLEYLVAVILPRVLPFVVWPVVYLVARRRRAPARVRL